jgi:hypothetical protein
LMSFFMILVYKKQLFCINTLFAPQWLAHVCPTGKNSDEFNSQL